MASFENFVLAPQKTCAHLVNSLSCHMWPCVRSRRSSPHTISETFLSLFSHHASQTSICCRILISSIVIISTLIQSQFAEFLDGSAKQQVADHPVSFRWAGLVYLTNSGGRDLGDI